MRSETPKPEAMPAKAFRPDLLALRRRMVGLSQAELADRAELQQATLSRIEQGLREPLDDHVVKLADALHCPASFFHQTVREYGPPMSAHPMFRKKTAVGQKVIDRVIADLNVRLAHLRTLLGAVDFKAELPWPQYELDDFGGDAEAVAESVRRAWYVPNGPIKSLTEFIERAGCLVVPCEMEAARIDGVSYRLPDLPPVIFLNRNQSADRMRFSLAHELGHLILHRYPHPDMEAEADRFAAALLMPRTDIGPELVNLTLEKAAYMKPVWRVSMAALLVRATTLSKVNKNQAEYLWRRLSAQGLRLREPASLDFPAEKTSLIDGLIRNLVDNLGYTEGDLERVLHLRYEEVAAMYGLRQQAGLRLVK